MNSDGSSSSTNFQQPFPDSDNTGPSQQDGPIPDPSDTDTRDKLRAQQARRATFLDDLIRNIDIVIYCQLSILYYLDCSLFRFLVRAIPEWIFFTPKPAFFPNAPANRPYIVTILATNASLFLSHMFVSAPSAGEALRGYLHGGLLIDFVGELGPISKLRLGAYDVAITILQLVILAVVLERRELRRLMDIPRAQIDIRNTNVLSNSAPVQDLDTEERGVRRSAEASQSGLGALVDWDIDDSIELARLQKENSAAATEAGARPSSHHLDIFYSGQLVVADLHIMDAIHTAQQATYITTNS